MISFIEVTSVLDVILVFGVILVVLRVVLVDVK